MILSTTLSNISLCVSGQEGFIGTYFSSGPSPLKKSLRKFMILLEESKAWENSLQIFPIGKPWPSEEFTGYLSCLKDRMPQRRSKEPWTLVLPLSLIHGVN